MLCSKSLFQFITPYFLFCLFPFRICFYFLGRCLAYYPVCRITHRTRIQQFDIKYSGHENRPKNLLLKSVTPNAPSQHDLIELKKNQAFMELKFEANQMPMATAVSMGPGPISTTIATTTNTTDTRSTTSIDLDINVNAIKNMLLTTRVPESCV